VRLALGAAARSALEGRETLLSATADRQAIEVTAAMLNNL
jgi:hypothetical protein